MLRLTALAAMLADKEQDGMSLERLSGGRDPGAV